MAAFGSSYDGTAPQSASQANQAKGLQILRPKVDVSSSGIPIFDIEEFQSPYIARSSSLPVADENAAVDLTTTSEKPLPIRNFAATKVAELKQAKEKARSPPVLPTAVHVNDQLTKDDGKVLLRDIGDLTICVSLPPYRPGYSGLSVADVVFASPVLLMLHAFRIKHDLRFLITPSPSDAPWVDIEFSKHLASFRSSHHHYPPTKPEWSALIPRGGKRRAVEPRDVAPISPTADNAAVLVSSEYSIVRQIAKRLGLYGVTGSDQEDIWIDNLLTLLSMWIFDILEHCDLVRRLTQLLDIDHLRVSSLPDEETLNALRERVHAYPARRQGFYATLSAHWTRKPKSHPSGVSSDNVDLWALLLQHILYCEGAFRESIIESIALRYTSLFEFFSAQDTQREQTDRDVSSPEDPTVAFTEEQDDLLRWLRGLHCSWVVDCLLSFPDLFEIQADVMNDNIVAGWYQEREAMLDTPHDHGPVLEYHRRIMDGDPMLPVNDEVKNDQSADIIQHERSAALSPRLTPAERTGRVVDNRPRFDPRRLPFENVAIHGGMIPSDLSYYCAEKRQMREPGIPSMAPHDVFVDDSLGDAVNCASSMLGHVPSSFDALHAPDTMQGDYGINVQHVSSSEYPSPMAFPIAKKSPINQRLCTSQDRRQPQNKKTFGLC